MDKKESQQERLINIKNLGDCLSVAIEKRHNTPDHADLQTIVKRLAEECEEYLKACPPLL